VSEVVVITGATAGVGRATVRRFARDGAAIALIARDREGLEAARKEVENAGGKALVLPVDVADADAVESAAQAVEEALGPIDIWINDAMTTVFAWFEDISPEEFERATRVTYLGAVWGTQAALKRMLPRNHGTIVQVGSALAYRGIPLQSAYCGAKHAMKGFFESLRTELRHKGSRVHMTMVQLPGLNTPQFEHCRTKMPNVPQPVAPVYQPEVAADAIHYAAHHRRREVWVGVPTVYTILGNKIAPGFAEWYLARSSVKGQQTNEPLGEEVREGNLFDAPRRDDGAHGPFDDKAHSRSYQLAFSKHRALAGAAAAVAAGAGAATALAARRDDGPRFFRR
jgi:short-subunit dehydrogenase